MSIFEKTLFKGKSNFNGDIKVTENSGTRRLVAGNNTQSVSLNKNGKSGLRYWDDMIPADIYLDAGARVLILGLGGGTTAKIITARFGPIAIDGVDIDPMMIEMGKKYFDMTEPNLKIYIEDAVDFVKGARYRYDLICLDVFVAGSVPSKIETKEFIANVKNILTDDGICTINKIFSGKDEKSAFESLIRSVFPYIESSVVKGDPRLDNVIIYAHK